MAEDNSDVDLFGDPVTASERGRGRPAHVPTRATVNRVILGFARGRSVKDVALSIGVSVPTLRQHYFSQVNRRRDLALMMESVQLGRLNDLAEKGNVTAEKALMKALGRGQLEQLPRSMVPSKAEKIGKKQQRHADATNAHKGSSWGDLVEAVPALTH